MSIVAVVPVTVIPVLSRPESFSATLASRLAAVIVALIPVVSPVGNFTLYVAPVGLLSRYLSTEFGAVVATVSPILFIVSAGHLQSLSVYIKTVAAFILRIFDKTIVALALSVAAPVDSIIIPASMPMMIITISSSTRVKPFALRYLLIIFFSYIFPPNLFLPNAARAPTLLGPDSPSGPPFDLTDMPLHIPPSMISPFVYIYNFSEPRLAAPLLPS